MSTPLRAEAATKSLKAIQTITQTPLRYWALDDSLRELLGRTCAVLAGDFAMILLLTEDRQSLAFRAGHGLEAKGQEEVLISIKHELIGRIRTQTGPLAVEDVARADLGGPLFPENLRSLLGVSLFGEGGNIGVLLVGVHTPRRFGEEDLHLIQWVAAQAATVIEQARLFEQVRAGRKRSQILSQQLMEAQEAERRRLARELHDEIGQALTAVKINLQALQRATSEAAAQMRLQDSLEIVERVHQQMRDLSLNLRPSLLDDLGLAVALRWYLDRQAQRAGFAIDFLAEPPDLRVSGLLETTCFRVAQEALTNVVRHARARSVRVELRQCGSELHLVIRDDGVGFEVEASRQRAARGGSLGLLGMQERVLLMGGWIDIKSSPGRGTEVRVRLPVTTMPSLERRSRRRDA
jgi:signal transduction histidine kinase